jgi:hypothetical protein
VEDYRRRPPMEGFSRPGSLGGEAWDDDDSVEGHIMNDEKTQDQDAEGHALWKASDDDDTEGHAATGKFKASDDDDTEGHAATGKFKASDDDDTEGHAATGKFKASDDDDDTEGHAKFQ